MNRVRNSRHPSPIGRGLTALTTAFIWLSVGLLLAIRALISGQVVMRNLFAQGVSWADELARFFGIALVFLSAPQLARQGQHIAVDVFQALLPRLARRIALGLVELAMLIFSGLMLWGFVLFLLRSGQFVTPALGMPNLWFYMPAALGMGLMGLVALWRLQAVLRGRLDLLEEPIP